MYFLLYSEFIKEYEELGYKRLASDRSPTPVNSHHLPHHGVLRESSSTKLRVVFNGSCKTSSRISLNEIMRAGAKIQKDISNVLLWSRQHRLIFLTDITKMFRQILVHQDDWPLQQILWKDSNDILKTYQLTTVIYGTRSAPFLASRGLLQLVEGEAHKFPLAVSPRTKGRYVDDICGGANTPEVLIKIAEKVKAICSTGCFPLVKWQSNSSQLLQEIAPESVSLDDLSIEECTSKILGLL